MGKKAREKAGKKAATVGIVGNIFLTVFNLVVGFYSGSYALISEGAHTISDITTSVISYAGFVVGSKPADREHPLGHGRAEAVAGLIIVVFLSIVGFEIFSGAIEKIFFGGAITTPTYLAAGMAVVGIIVNFAMSQYIINMGRKIKSPAIVADGQHQRVDIISSISILVGVVVANMGYPKLDPIIGLIISLMIFKTAVEVAKDNLDNIMGKIPSEELIEQIKKAALSVDKVCGAHDIRINYFGSYATVTMHIEVPQDLNIVEAHEISHKVQDEVISDIDIIHGVTVHTCPVGIKYDHNQQLDQQ